MSTMLKTAAMSLLSKTLQTFLYKYLLDVDVEGVAMPSFMDADGQSGWGVRLVNVRLREGVELMTLPGKRKVKRPKPKDDSPKEKEEEVDETVKVPSTNEVANVSVSTGEAPKSSSKPADADTEDANVEASEQQTLLSQDYYAADDDDGVVLDRAPSRVLSCFSRGGRRQGGPSTPTESNTKVDDDGKQNRAIRDKITESLKEPEKPSVVEQPKVCDEEDELIEVEKDMVLRLGTGGRIGVLDVRLVGKELHVSVEDAFLVVEACQKPDESEKVTDAEKAAEASRSEEQKGKDAAADKKKAAASKKAAKDMTVGERVLEKSAIARALAAVPHLFLRDVCVRIVVRDGHVTSEAEEEISEMDSVVDFGIELLSVTSGEDFLAHIRAELDDPRARFAAEQNHHSMSSFASFDETSDNEFIVKRIRTGRGPEGGIWLKIFPPGRIRTNKTLSDNVDDGVVQWARERWVAASRFCLFRCSGLDMVSRIYVGKQEPESNEYFFYDEFIVDSMLVGVDYTAAGSAPSLPPLEQNGDAAELEVMQAMREANEYVTDENGIQRVSIKSVFHKVARGLQPIVCKSGHLPCETCPECWTVDGTSAQTVEHPLDASTPLAGVVFNLSLNDPLEINLDRASLEVIGQLQSLFTKKSTVSISETLAEEAEAEVDLSASIHGGRMCMPSQRQKSSDAENVTDSFPSYMQPENIEIMGLHLAKIVCRIHVMRSDQLYDRGLSFCYWEVQTRCITLDMQTLSSQKQLQDVRVDVGQFTAVEFKGIGKKQLISMGLQHPEISSSDASNSSQPPKSSSRPPWPSTAYSLLGIPVPMETIHYESRERHALQMRYTALSGSSTDENRSVVDVRVGVTSVDMPFKIQDDIYAVIHESQKSVFGTPEDEKPTTVDTPANIQPTKTKSEVSAKSSLLLCKVRVDGGRVNVSPVISLCLPPSTFFVEQSSRCGLFFETMLQRMEFAYGERATVAKSCRGNLSRLAALPEGIRLRILLFVKDLGPLEAALGLKHEPNSFQRYRGVNRAIVRVAKRSSKLKRKKRESHISTDRREEMLAELLNMDDTELQDLWALHQGSKDASKTKLT